MMLEENLTKLIELREECYKTLSKSRIRTRVVISIDSAINLLDQHLLGITADMVPTPCNECNKERVSNIDNDVVYWVCWPCNIWTRVGKDEM